MNRIRAQKLNAAIFPFLFSFSVNPHIRLMHSLQFCLMLPETPLSKNDTGNYRTNNSQLSTKLTVKRVGTKQLLTY